MSERHRFDWRVPVVQFSKRPEVWTGEGMIGLSGKPESKRFREAAIGCCFHCFTLSRFDAVGPRGGLIQVYQPNVGDAWTVNSPTCEVARDVPY